MGLLSFIKEAGEKLFSKGQAQMAMTAAKADPSSAERAKAANDAAGDAILAYIDTQGLKATGLTVTFDGATATAAVYGVADNQATKEKIVLCCGNVEGVGSVNDQMNVDQSEPEAQYYTVVRGDNLSKISKRGPEQVREDLRGEQTDAEEPRPHLSGTDVAHTAAVNR